MKIGVFGSRTGIPDGVIEKYLTERFRPDVTLVSGGADGADKRAETCWRRLGGEVLSLRPVKDGDVWTVEWVELCDRPWVYIPAGQVDFMDWQSAVWYRSMLIADIADRGVAFWDGRSRGTTFTIGIFQAEKKPCAVHRV